MIPTPTQFEVLTGIPASANYTQSEKALMVLLALETFSPDLEPWKLKALRTQLVEQTNVEALDAMLATYADEQGISLLSADALNKVLTAQVVNSPQCADWVVAQQAAAPVKHITRLLLQARHLIAEVEQLYKHDTLVMDDNGNHQSSTILLLPHFVRNGMGPIGVVVTPTLSFFNDWSDSPGSTAAGWMMEDEDRLGGYMWQAQFKTPQEPLTEAATPEPSVIVAAQPDVAPNAKTLELLKASILAIIKEEANKLLAADKLAAIVAQQVQNNPTILQAALGKSLNVGQNPQAGALFQQVASQVLGDYLKQQGQAFLQQVIAGHLKGLVNPQKVEAEAIKQLTSNVDGYFASIFSRVVVMAPGGMVIGSLGFKDSTTLKAPMPKHGLPSTPEKVEDIPF